MLRRLHPEQPAAFAFTAANLAWAEGQIAKYPPGRQASAIIPLLWRAQEQEGWLTRPAIEYVADLLAMPYMRALEVATFYFMFQLAPVGRIAHIQICGTTSCLICGAEELIAVCKKMIAEKPHTLSADGNFSWEEVECMGACANAPMAQIGKDYYEDLTAERLRDLLTRFAKGEVPVPGPQNGRYASEPLGGLTSLKDFAAGRAKHNASAQRAVDLKDTVKRIDGSEVPLLTPWLGKGAAPKLKAAVKGAEKPAVKAAVKTAVKAAVKPADKAAPKAAPKAAAKAGVQKPKLLKAPRRGKADDLTALEGVGPKLAAAAQALGIFHYDQIAAWTKAELAWVDENLEGFRGRATRDNWVKQAKALMKKA